MAQEMTILVIDDNPLVLESMLAFLQSEGHKVQTAQSGRRGVELAEEEHPDLIVSNFDMPDIDGLEVFRTLRQLPPTAQIPFVFFSAHGTHTLREQCLQLGADAFIDKSTGLNELLDLVNHLTNGKQEQP